jgi:hypothetical protein
MSGKGNFQISNEHKLKDRGHRKSALASRDHTSKVDERFTEELNRLKA